MMAHDSGFGKWPSLRWRSAEPIASQTIGLLTVQQLAGLTPDFLTLSDYSPSSSRLRVKSG
jgi:hypothetical protein